MKRLCALLLIAFFTIPQSAFAWGNDGHMWINYLAAKHLPKSMPSFLRESADRLMRIDVVATRYVDHEHCTYRTTSLHACVGQR